MDLEFNNCRCFYLTAIVLSILCTGVAFMSDALKEFLNYTESYKQYGEKVLLKIRHTVRVRDLCIEISDSLGLSGDDTALAAACGLLHDIGRFEQWKQYQTFNDQRSVDHGALGAEVLCADGLIGRFSETDHGTILNAVKYHNRFMLPDALNARDRLFAGIVRDADKIDILRLYVTGGLVCRTKGTAMSDPVLGALSECRAIQRESLNTKADEIAIRLGFVFGLNHRRSFEIVRENDYIGRMIDVQLSETANETLKAQLEALKPRIRRYVDIRSLDRSAAD